ncbi:MAG: MBL fold metallo-hydrolase [Pseudoalteromonas spongiae]
MNPRYKLAICAVISLLAGCASNKITTINNLNADGASLKQGRYINRYPGNKTYPYSCEENCYPPTDDIHCESDMEQCQYRGKNPKLTTHSGYQIHWLGHASFEIKTPSGKRFLFDPVFGEFDWPVNWAYQMANGFERQSPKSKVQNLSDVDAVLYSHLHYDHFNKHDIALIGNKPKYLVPLNFAKHFDRNHYTIHEMDWFTTHLVAQTKVHFVPAHHFNSRIWVPFLYNDDNQALWGGWVLEENGKTLFFAGDTGYSNHFKDIQRQYGDIDVCLLPIASYFHQEHETWYRYVHTRPEDAIAAANDLNCKVTIPWGYGNASWQMGDHSSHSALFRLLHTLKLIETDSQFYIMNEGERLFL